MQHIEAIIDAATSAARNTAPPAPAPTFIDMSDNAKKGTVTALRSALLRSGPRPDGTFTYAFTEGTRAVNTKKATEEGQDDKEERSSRSPSRRCRATQSRRTRTGRRAASGRCRRATPHPARPLRSPRPRSRARPSRSAWGRPPPPSTRGPSRRRLVRALVACWKKGQGGGPSQRWPSARAAFKGSCRDARRVLQPG